MVAMSMVYLLALPKTGQFECYENRCVWIRDVTLQNRYILESVHVFHPAPLGVPAELRTILTVTSLPYMILMWWWFTLLSLLLLGLFATWQSLRAEEHFHPSLMWFSDSIAATSLFVSSAYLFSAQGEVTNFIFFCLICAPFLCFSFQFSWHVMRDTVWSCIWEAHKELCLISAVQCPEVDGHFTLELSVCMFTVPVTTPKLSTWYIFYWRGQTGRKTHIKINTQSTWRSPTFSYNVFLSLLRVTRRAKDKSINVICDAQKCL